MIEYLLKVIVLAVVLRYLRVLDIQSILMFAVSSFLLFFAYGVPRIPEFIVFCTMSIFFLWISVFAVVDNWDKFNLRSVKLSFLGKYFKFFCTMIVISFFMLQLFEFADGVLLYAGALAVYFILVLAQEKYGAYFQKFGFVSYRNAFLVIVLYCALFLKYGLALQLLAFGFVYVLVFLLYRILYNSFTVCVKADELAPGMILAEHIVKKGRTYMKSGVFFINPLSVFRTMFSRKVRGEKLVFGSFRSLSEGDIRVIKKIMSTYGIDDIRVQRMVDMRPYVLAGVLVLFFALYLDIFFLH